MDWVSIDFETATGSRASACALGLVTVIGNEVCERRSWLIQPPANEYSWFNTGIHGICAEHTAHAPTFIEMWPEVLPYLDGALVLAHNAPFDVGVLRASLDSAGLPCPPLRYLCTLAMSRALFRELRAHTLPLVARHCGVGLRHHDACSDAHAAACVAIDMCGRTGAPDVMALARQLHVEPRHLAASPV